MIKANTNQKQTKSKSIGLSIRRHAFRIVFAINITLFLTNILVLSLIPKQTETVIVANSEILAQELQNQSAQKLITDLQSTQEEKTKLEESLPNKNSLLEVIEFFESLKNTVNVQSFQFLSEEAIKDSNGFNFIPIALVLEGNLSQTMSALHKLQTSKYVFYVNQTLIESPEGVSKSVKVSITLRLYVRNPFTEN